MDFVATPGLDPTHDVLQYGRQALDAIFAPKSVAVIGATETVGSVGRTIVWNLMSSTFGGTIYPVNPKRASILGIKAYPSLSAVPEVVDLIVVVTPADSHTRHYQGRRRYRCKERDHHLRRLQRDGTRRRRVGAPDPGTRPPR